MQYLSQDKEVRRGAENALELEVIACNIWEAFVLSLPGKSLDVPLLVNKKKFRNRGGRDGALDAMRRLEEKGLGKLALKKSKGSVNYCIYSSCIPNSSRP